MLFHKNKCIVIAGCGPLGAALAKSLYKKGHKVVVLDKDMGKPPLPAGGVQGV